MSDESTVMSDDNPSVEKVGIVGEKKDWTSWACRPVVAKACIALLLIVSLTLNVYLAIKNHADTADLVENDKFLHAEYVFTVQPNATVQPNDTNEVTINEYLSNYCDQSTTCVARYGLITCKCGAEHVIIRTGEDGELETVRSWKDEPVTDVAVEDGDPGRRLEQDWTVSIYWQDTTTRTFLNVNGMSYGLSTRTVGFYNGAPLFTKYRTKYDRQGVLQNVYWYWGSKRGWKSGDVGYFNWKVRGSYGDLYSAGGNSGRRVAYTRGFAICSSSQQPVGAGGLANMSCQRRSSVLCPTSWEWSCTVRLTAAGVIVGFFEANLGGT